MFTITEIKVEITHFKIHHFGVGAEVPRTKILPIIALIMVCGIQKIIACPVNAFVF